MKVKPETQPQARLSVRVTPRASANAVVRFENGVLHLRLTAPPVGGAANAACCAFVAEALGVRVGQVTVVGGHKSRDEMLLVTGLCSEEVRARLGTASHFSSTAVSSDDTLLGEEPVVAGGGRGVLSAAGV